MNHHFDKLVELIARLPGIGPRHATRVVLALLNRPPGQVKELADAIARMPSAIQLCRECFNVSDNAHCAICKDSLRQQDSVLVVEKISDLQAMERTGLWKGRYHVLGGSIDPVGNGNHGQLHIPQLKRRLSSLVKAHGSAEAVLATGTDTAGEATALYLKRELSDIIGLTLTRLGRGLATGAHLEYADELTLRHAVESRK
jgi:recombination protein RecR